jgi:hypothetical protein
VTIPLDPECPSPVAVALARVVITGTAAMCADLREMGEGRYTGRHSQAWLDGPRAEEGS